MRHNLSRYLEELSSADSYARISPGTSRGEVVVVGLCDVGLHLKASVDLRIPASSGDLFGGSYFSLSWALAAWCFSEMGHEG